ncbi:MAG: hypothetical protein JO257_23690 [Deltaproteobacteria bacterium]|nr:hypothetical protein [Deltaproteobacteria bacterium]
MGRFEPTAPLDGGGYSVASLRWETQLGALGPSDGSMGAASNVPSALSVLRHSELYLPFPDEIEEAFGVLETHCVRDEQLYPVSLATLPFLFATLRTHSPLGERIAELIARFTAASGTLQEIQRARFLDLIVSHAKDISGWLNAYDRALCAIALRVPELRTDLLAAVTSAEAISPVVLLALIDLAAAPGRTRDAALVMLNNNDETIRMCAAAFLSRYGERTPEMTSRINTILTPAAADMLKTYVRNLWTPTVERPAVAPKLLTAEVMFAGEKVVLVRAGDQRVALPWANAQIERGTQLQIGLTVHGEPVLALLTDDAGAVRVIEF